jgi:hypothetical protein
LLQLEKELIYDGRKRSVVRKDFNRLIKDMGFISNNIDKYLTLPKSKGEKLKKKI